MSKKLILSVNDQKIQRKSEGAPLTGFNIKTFDSSDVDELKELFQSNCYSNNQWGNPKPGDKKQGYHGSANNNNYVGMHGVILDVDEPGLNIDEAKEKFKDYFYIIHTSSGHQVNKPEKGGIVDRYRIILPFEPRFDNEPYYVSNKDTDQLHSFLKWKYSFSDPTVFQRARKLYPFAGQDRSLYQFHVNDGKYIAFSLDEIQRGLDESNKKTMVVQADANVERKRIEQEKHRIQQSIDNEKKTQINITTGEAYYSPSGEEYLIPDEVIKAKIGDAWV